MDLEEMKRLLAEAAEMVAEEESVQDKAADFWRAGYEEYWETRLDKPKHCPPRVAEGLVDAYYDGHATACLEHRILDRDEPSPPGKEPDLYNFAVRACRKLKRPGDPAMLPNNDYADPENN